jgi:hypothetical protein
MALGVFLTVRLLTAAHLIIDILSSIRNLNMRIWPAAGSQSGGWRSKLCPQLRSLGIRCIDPAV